MNLSTEERNELTQSWLSFSATNIVFDHHGHLILGILNTNNKKSIPESGKTCLIGGFNNGILPSPTNFKSLADKHLSTMLGLNVDDNQCSEFYICEYNMAEIKEPLSTKFGNFQIKRVAFNRIVQLNEQQSKNIAPSGKIKDTVTLSRDNFIKYINKNGGDNCRFKHQISHILMGFDKVKPSIFKKLLSLFKV